MKILEKLKNGLKEFNEMLGTDIDDENENDFPADIAGELTKSQENVGNMEDAQEQLWNSKPTNRSKLANELIVHEDGTIKQKIEKENTMQGEAKPTKATKSKTAKTKQVEDNERVQ